MRMLLVVGNDDDDWFARATSVILALVLLDLFFFAELSVCVCYSIPPAYWVCEWLTTTAAAGMYAFSANIPHHNYIHTYISGIHFACSIIICVLFTLYAQMHINTWAILQLQSYAAHDDVGAHDAKWQKQWRLNRHCNTSSTCVCVETLTSSSFVAQDCTYTAMLGSIRMSAFIMRSYSLIQCHNAAFTGDVWHLFGHCDSTKCFTSNTCNVGQNNYLYNNKDLWTLL